MIMYDKLVFTKEEKEDLKHDCDITIQNYNSTKIPIIILLDSNILKITRHKYLVQNDMSIQDFINIINKRLINYNESDTLVYKVTKMSTEPIYTNIHSTFRSIEQLYKDSKDPETNFLIITISRHTTYKYIKNFIRYFW